MDERVEETEITSHAPDDGHRASPTPPRHDVFVSYCPRDEPVADAIVTRLEQAGIRCCVAPRDAPPIYDVPGSEWDVARLREIKASRLMVVVLSGESNRSRQVLYELAWADDNDLVVVPFRIESIYPTGLMALFLAHRGWLDAVAPPLESQIGQLVRVVQALIPSTGTWWPKPPSVLVSPGGAGAAARAGSVSDAAAAPRTARTPCHG